MNSKFVYNIGRIVWFAIWSFIGFILTKILQIIIKPVLEKLGINKKETK